LTDTDTSRVNCCADVEDTKGRNYEGGKGRQEKGVVARRHTKGSWSSWGLERGEFAIKARMGEAGCKAGPTHSQLRKKFMQGWKDAAASRRKELLKKKKWYRPRRSDAHGIQRLITTRGKGGRRRREEAVYRATKRLGAIWPHDKQTRKPSTLQEK